MAKNGIDICRLTGRMHVGPKKAVGRFTVLLSCYFRSVLYIIGVIYNSNLYLGAFADGQVWSSADFFTSPSKTPQV